MNFYSPVSLLRLHCCFKYNVVAQECLADLAIQAILITSFIQSAESRTCVVGKLRSWKVHYKWRIQSFKRQKRKTAPD